jgi:hypothetical protein
MRFLLPRAATAPLAVLFLAAGAFAQGVVDQQNDPAGGSGFGCGSPTPILNGSVQQGFVPQASNLIAVELRLMAGSAFPSGGTTTTARIRDGSTSGTILGQSTASVAGPLSANTQLLVRFDFTQIPLTPGNTYVIEWVTPATTELMWVGQGGDPYPAGTAYSCSGNPWPVSGTDFNFITYEAAPDPAASEGPATDCDGLLAQLRAAVEGLELQRFKRCSTTRLLDEAGRHMDRGQSKAACANVLALECQIRVLARFGIISDDEKTAILDLAEAFRECVGSGGCDHAKSNDSGSGRFEKRTRRHH